MVKFTVKLMSQSSSTVKRLIEHESEFSIPHHAQEQDIPTVASHSVTMKISHFHVSKMELT